MAVKVVLVGTLDTKGKEIEFLRQCIEENGAEAIIVDVSCKQALDEAIAHHPCEVVANAADLDFRKVALHPKAEAARIMAKGASRVIARAIEEGGADAVVAVGGGSGTALGCEVLRALPRGIPKVMISAVAASDMSWHIRTKDIMVVNAVVDICLNRILREVFINAAHATIAMARRWRANSSRILAEEGKPLVAATMYGVTQPCVSTARDLLEAKGYEVVIFSGGGLGPTSMEELATDGAIDLVMDITTTSLIDEVVGGKRSSGPGRLSAVGSKGLPQVVAPGAVDLVNFGPPHTIPNKFKDRLFYRHTSTTTLMRANTEELIKLAQLMADRLNKARGPVAVLVPKKGFSKYDHEKGPLGMAYDGRPSDRPWWDPEANLAFSEALRNKLDPNRVKFKVINSHINDRAFAEELVAALLRFVYRDLDHN